MSRANFSRVSSVFLALLLSAIMVVGLLTLLGAKPAWAASRSFTPVQTFPVENPSPTVTEDFNSDGKADLAGQRLGADKVSVLFDNSDGTFQTTQDFAVGGRPSFVTSADFNGDYKPDLAVASRDSDNVSVLLGKGDGTFQDAQTFSVGDSPVHVTSADFNGDDKADLATADAPFSSSAPDGVTVLLGNGNGTFQAARHLTAGVTPKQVVTADVNSDGKTDLDRCTE